MPHILKNRNLEIYIDFPDENYNFSRFDWTGKISKVSFHGVPVSTAERTDDVDENLFGKAFYNEFGIDTALGFEDVEIGDWFHKIGVGLLKKTAKTYDFYKKHDIKPAKFEVFTKPNQLVIICKSETKSGYTYILKKTITLLESGFKIDYSLQNTGVKDLITDEYVHNFIAINDDLMGSNYVLKFPFKLKPESFDEIVNSEQKIDIVGDSMKFNGSPKEQFFFSNVTGNKEEVAKWELMNIKSKIAISESATFSTNKINVWGWEHVISPELFHKIHVKPGDTSEWSRTFNVYRFTYKNISRVKY